MNESHHRIQVEVDPDAGFCFGVTCAIQQAEVALKEGYDLYSLGDIVHNSKEVDRLSEIGLKSISYEQYRQLKNATVLLRAHGEPPETYRIAHDNNIKLIDATCPVVLRLQYRIKEGYDEMKKKNGQIVIFGKKGHAEVIGLKGQTQNQALVITGLEDLNVIDFSRPVLLYSQTTMQNDKYLQVRDEIERRMVNKENFRSYNTICKKVGNRVPDLKEFAGRNELIIFVSGKKSSNGRMLYDICHSINSNTYFVTEASELQDKWFEDVKRVGVSGATSTPHWVLEKVANKIESLNHH